MTPAERLAKHKKNNPRPFEIQDKVYLRHDQVRAGVEHGVTGIVQGVVQARPEDIYAVTFPGVHVEGTRTIHVTGRDLLLCRPSAKRVFSSSGSLPNIHEVLDSGDVSEGTILEGQEPLTK